MWLGWRGHQGYHSGGPTDNSHFQYGHTYYPLGIPPITGSYNSFVNPNARCPVCKEAVFFYLSPYGGRVFFDELGPPWPKHPCTDNSARPLILDCESVNSAKTYAWQSSGWSPVRIASYKEYGRGIVRLLVLGDEVEKGLYVRKSDWGEREISDDGLMGHIKEVAKGKYRVSLIAEKGRLLELVARQFASDIETSLNGPSGSKGKVRQHLITPGSPKGEKAIRKHREGQRESRKNNQRAAKKSAKTLKDRANVKPVKLPSFKASLSLKPKHNEWPKNSAIADALKSLGFKRNKNLD